MSRHPFTSRERQPQGFINSPELCVVLKFGVEGLWQQQTEAACNRRLPLGTAMMARQVAPANINNTTSHRRLPKRPMSGKEPRRAGNSTRPKINCVRSCDISFPLTFAALRTSLTASPFLP